VGPRTTGWMLVGIQFALLAGLIVLPNRADWPTPVAVDVVGWGLMGLGGLLALVASRDLGSALTPTPEPRDDERLRTGGLYRYVRHPIYSGVLLIAAGLVVRSGSWISLAVGAATVLFFDAKAAWEERRLAERHPDYPAYAARVGRFVPRIATRRAR
jgi:protein-S-isoprenylcysteine O-methyltransferase Ste14